MSLTRRKIISAAALGGAGWCWPAMAAPPPAAPRALAFANLHTGERLKVEYWNGGDYESQALESIAWVLRDHRTNGVRAIEPRLLDALHLLKSRLERDHGFEVISGYRSPASNAALRDASKGVASQSLHMQGMAIDVRLPGVKLNHLRDAALSLKAGGVGYYPSSNFVHIDVGRVRAW